MSTSYNENVIIIPKKEKYHKKLVSYIDFDKQTYNCNQMQKHIQKFIAPVLEKKLGLDDITYLRLQLISLQGENQFYNSDTYYYCNEVQSYNCFYFFSPMKFYIIPQSHSFKMEKKISALKAYKTKKTIDCNEGTILCIPSNSHYYFDSAEGCVLQLYDVVNKKNVDSYTKKLKTVEVNKNVLLQKFSQRMGLCYKNKLHFMYHWVHFFYYASVKNDFHYKLCLTDIPHEKKSGRIISYENRPRIIWSEAKKNTPIHFNKFVVLNHIEHCTPDNYYLYKFIRIMILLMTLSICIIFWKDNEVRTFLGNKYKPVSNTNISSNTSTNTSINTSSNESISVLTPLVDTC